MAITVILHDGTPDIVSKGTSWTVTTDPATPGYLDIGDTKGEIVASYAPGWISVRDASPERRHTR